MGINNVAGEGLRQRIERCVYEKNNDKVAVGWFSSIKFKMIGSYVFMVGCIILVGFLSYITGAEAIQNNYKTTAVQSMDMLGEYIDFGFQNVKGIAVEYLTDAQVMNYLTGKMSVSETEQMTYYNDKKAELVTKSTADSFIKDIYFISDGVASLSTNKKSAEGLYSQYMNSEQGAFVSTDMQKYYWLGKSSPIDEVLETDTSSYAVRVVKNFYKKDAMLVIDIDTQAISSILEQIDFGDGSRVAFVTGDGTELLKDGSREAVFSTTDFYKVALESEETAGIIENVVLDGKEYLFVFRKMEGTYSMVCALIPNEEILMQVANIRYIAMIVVLIACIIAVIVGGGISLSINKTIKYFIENIKKVAQGKIGTRFTVKKKDEFAYLAGHMNKMLDSVMELLENAKEVSSEVSSSVENVMSSSHTIYDSSNHISTAMEEIELGLTQQADDTMVGVEMLEKLADQMRIVEEGTTEIKNIADSTQKSIGSSVKQMHDLKGRAGETTQITGQVITNVMKLNEKTKEIDTIINAINAIAEETSLLALNASIEAARAGEAGKGFMVVADSIQQLAVQSVNATSRISDIVESIDGEIGAVVDIANKADGIIKIQELAVADTQESFDEMSSEVKILLDKLNAIIDSVAKMQSDKEVTVEKMQSISAVTEEVVASVSTVATKTQDQVGIVNGLQGLSDKLSEQAKLLDASMKQFTIE